MTRSGRDHEPQRTVVPPETDGGRLRALLREHDPAASEPPLDATEAARITRALHAGATARRRRALPRVAAVTVAAAALVVVALVGLHAARPARELSMTAAAPVPVPPTPRRPGAVVEPPRPRHALRMPAPAIPGDFQVPRRPLRSDSREIHLVTTNGTRVLWSVRRADAPEGSRSRS